MRWLLVLFALVTLNGCGMGYVVKTYGDTKVDEVTVNESTYRIFHRPDLRKIMATPSLGKAFTSGLSLGAYDPASRKGMDLACEKYLAGLGYRDCVVTRGEEVLSQQVEFTYQCGPQEGKTPPAASSGTPPSAPVPSKP